MEKIQRRQSSKMYSEILISKDLEDKKDSRKLGIGLFTSVIIASICNTFLNSFFSIYMQQKYVSLKNFHFGLIMSSYVTANFITSLILGKYLEKLKRKQLVLIALITLFITLIGFTFMSYIPSDRSSLFLVFGILLRLIQGTASAFI